MRVGLPMSHFFFVLLILLIVLAFSVGVYWLLIRRWTIHRQWVGLAEWARNHRFRLRPLDSTDLPAPLANLPAAQPRLWLTNEMTTLLQIDTAAPPGVKQTSSRWHLLLHKTEAEHPPTGLRPVVNTTSLLDLFSMSSYPSLGGTDRFIVFGSQPENAKELAESSAAALLPPDIGLLLHGHYLILDFSSRPFDAIEFGRVLTLADQIAAHV